MRFYFSFLKRYWPMVVLSGFNICFFSKNSFSQTPGLNGDSVTVAIAPSYDSVSNFHRFWLGKGYRKIWAAPVQLKVFRLQNEKGGLKPIDIGGGFQTKSLRLKDASGKNWVLRSVQKFPERRLPPKLRNTVAQRILQDQVVTVHPFGALTIPPLAKALGLAHTNPQIVYVPDDPALGKFRSEFANSVLLFEERGAIDTFKTINTEAVQAELEGPDDLLVNQRAVLRARLLDMLVGDWDRHEGQWRWEQRKVGNETQYFPVPHDRDYVFYNTSGVLPHLVASQWATARFQGFQNEINFIETFNFNNRYFDRYFLNGLSENDWREEIEHVQMTLTDGLIRNAVRRMPDTIFALTGEHIVETLVSRRSNLKKDALTYYRFMSENVDVPASAKPERFVVEHKPEGRVVISVFAKNKSTAERKTYQREFDPAVTKEVRLYGMGGNDTFWVSGTETSPIKIRMIGGDGVDSFGISNNSQNKRQVIIYDRRDQKNIYPEGARLRLSADTIVNQYNRYNFKYNISVPIVHLFFNVDQRTFATIGWAFQKNGFRKEPYASRHEIVGGYSPARGSFIFRYNADWRQVFGKYGVNLNFLSIGPKNQSNFFGTGNETKFTNDNGKTLSYYRNRYDFVNADLRITRHVSSHATWSIGPAAQYYTSKQENNKTRFLMEYNRLQPDEFVFQSRVHAGIGAGLAVDTRTSGALPTNGVLFTLDMRAMQQLRGDQRSFGAVRGDLNLFTRLSKDSGTVLLNRVGAGTTIGNPAFYQMMQIGGSQTLRGFNLNRFTGRSMAYHNAELRFKLFQFTSYLFPGTFGLIGFNDVGRVWMPGERSTTWHHGYGGGIFIVPANVFTLRAVVGRSRESTQAYLNFVYGL